MLESLDSVRNAPRGIVKEFGTHDRAGTLVSLARKLNAMGMTAVLRMVCVSTT
ncbi:hypothetical protein M407DRAFT_246072 [Tulasnella calospora MUT 4182]|uniref:Uncharacterized protein n=1 Tax=Tulasnella calospora MUT 4182 TaxID=1051891 RepID=A0A0C3Q7W9_9AGAM|nr:hypothetical protein M407DRAFT_246072 [Tulasnella calospora MUT 4182]